MSTTKQMRRTDEQGVVSLMVTLIMMLVISLIVIGFSQVARRNARETLDTQLGLQAYYAAETGVNDATAVLMGGTVAHPYNSKCTGAGSFIATYLSNPAAPNSVLQQNSDGTPAISYSCVFVNPKPINFIKSKVSNNVPTLVPMQLSAAPAYFTVEWDASDELSANPANCNAGSSFPAYTSSGTHWDCRYAMLRMDLTQGSGTDAASLADGTQTIFFKPTAAGTPGNFSTLGAPTSDAIVNATCDSTTDHCTATVNLSGSASGTQYYMRITSLYKAEAKNLVVTPRTTTDGSINIGGAQATVDVTGKAQDVLRRIRVRVPLTAREPQNLVNDAVSSAGSICKRFTAGPGILTTPTNLCDTSESTVASGDGSLSPGTRLDPDTTLYSPNGAFVLKMQKSDGNLVLRDLSGNAIWNSGTGSAAHMNSYAIFQTDGNLVVYDSHGVSTWSSGTANYPTGSNHATSMKMQNDGNLVLYTADGTAVWGSQQNRRLP